MSLMPFTMGADPEFFLRRGNRNVSAHDLVPGTKEKPYKVKGGAIQADGTAVEFNIDPASSANEFVTNIETVLKQLREIVPKEFKFHFAPTVTYNPAYFKIIPDDSKVLGCDPDMNAHTLRYNNAPNATGTMRSAGGHIHYGWTKNQNVQDEYHMWDAQLVIKSMEKLLLPLLLGLEPTNKRRQLYGTNGACRVKSYGVEYRTPSNDWLNHPDIWPLLFNTSKYVFDYLESGTGFIPYQEFPMEGSKETVIRNWKRTADMYGVEY